MLDAGDDVKWNYVETIVKISLTALMSGYEHGDVKEALTLLKAGKIRKINDHDLVQCFKYIGTPLLVYFWRLDYSSC